MQLENVHVDNGKLANFIHKELHSRSLSFTCRTCSEEKPHSAFVRHKNMSHGIDYECKVCRNARRKKYCAENVEKRRVTERKAHLKRYYADHEESKRKYRVYFKHLRATNVKVRLDHRMGVAIRETLHNGTKGGRKWSTLVGYDVVTLMQHLEAQFTPGMTWDNYGHVWVIDHIVPKVFFIYDNVDSDAFRACWALCNLQPLLWEENSRKGARYTI